MKRKLMIAGLVIICILAGGLLVLQIGIDFSVKQNIRLAQQKYPGTAEDALISYMMDENISPEGKTCYGRHDSLLCQYEIHKAIVDN